MHSKCRMGCVLYLFGVHHSLIAPLIGHLERDNGSLHYYGLGYRYFGLFLSQVDELSFLPAANASSSATTTALLNELAISQPSLLQRSTQTIPDMFPKAYRWVDEMREISTFVSGPMGDVHRGLASVFEIVEKSVNGDGNARQVLEKFVKDAEAVLKDTQ